MIRFTSMTPVGGKVIPTVPKKPDDGDCTQRPLGGLVTPPKSPKTPTIIPNRPLGGLVAPRPMPLPNSPRPNNRPLGGLITPKPQKPDSESGGIVIPGITKDDSTTKKILKAAAYAIGLITVLTVGTKCAKKFFAKKP